MFSYCKKPSKTLKFLPLFPNLKAITEILCADFFGLMTLKIYIFQLFVLFKCKNVKQKDPDKFFREMSHLKAHNFLNILAQFLFVDHEI
jgi:hypothetical protein